MYDIQVKKWDPVSKIEVHKIFQGLHFITIYNFIYFNIFNFRPKIPKHGPNNTILSRLNF